MDTCLCIRLPRRPQVVTETSRPWIQFRSITSSTNLSNLRPALLHRENTKLHFQAPISLGRFPKHSILAPISFSFEGFHSTSSVTTVNQRDLDGQCENDWACGRNICARWFRSVFLSRRWWNLSDSVSVDGGNEKSMSISSALWRIWGLVESGGVDRWVVFGAFASLSVAALSEISMPSLLAASVFAAESGEGKVFFRHCQLLVLLWLSSGICSGLRAGLFAIANAVLVERLRESLYSVLLLQDIPFFDTESVGSLTSRLSADCQKLSNAIANNIHMIVRNTIQGLGALINLMTLSWPLALSSLGTCFILASIFLIYGPYQKEAAKITRELEAHANEIAQEAFELVRTIRIHGIEEEQCGRYGHWLKKIASINLRESIAYGLWNLSFNTLYRSTQVLAVVLGGVWISTGRTSPEELLKYILYCEWLIYATWRLVDNSVSLLQSIGSCETVFWMMDLLPSSQCSTKGTRLPKLRGKVDFVNVSFRYTTRLQIPVLQHLDLAIQANETVAIVGLSGSGKSTLVKLLLRLYDPMDGEILIDDIPVKDLDIRWLRGKMGYVGQEPHLFRMDVKSNLTYGFQGDISEEDIEWAAKLANAHEFITSLPNGYETLVDDNLLSGGQKQRIAIARAILRDPAILILDEATSALDMESEHHITEVLSALKNSGKVKCTTIIIAHRLSTVRIADRIIVLDGGKIVEMGNHDELIEKEGLYAHLLKMQSF